MPVTLKCPDCGHTMQAPDDKPRTCPECEGSMKKPAYQAKSGPTSSDKAKSKATAEPQPKAEAPPAKKPAAAKPAPAPAEPDNPFAFGDDADEPRPKKAAAARPAKKAEPEPEPLPLDEDEAGDERGSGGSTRDDRAAKSLDIDPGFRNKKLMRQVEEELSRGEVLHWAGRMHPEIARKNAQTTLFAGIAFAAIGGIVALVMFLAPIPWYVGLFPLLFVAIGIALAILGPRMTIKQAELGWYAVTDRRAIVYAPSAFGSGGRATSYEPRELRRMRVEKSKAVDGAGDLIFKTRATERRTDYVDRRGRLVKSETSRSETNYGFLGIDNVREVETLIHNVLLGGDADREDERGDDGE